MMQKRMMVVICIVSILISLDVRYINAQSGNCDFVGTLMQSRGEALDPASGVTVESQILEPNNVVVVGQDPEEVGVSIEITIKSQIGVIEHDETIGSQVCRHYGQEQSGMQGCDGKASSPDYPTYGNKGHYYFRTETRCIRHYSNESPGFPAENVYRKVKGVRVWLEPSKATTEWLGWGMTTSGGRASVRYIYPSRWMVGNWEGDGFSTQRTLDARWDIPYYQNWLETVGAVDFLAGDAYSGPLWSMTMPEVASPMTNVMALGVTGEMKVSNSFAGSDSIPSASATEVVNCLDLKTKYIEYDPNFLKKSYQINCPSNPPYDTSSSGIYTMTFEHIPMDLPGQWYIGVMVELDRAKFINVDYYGTKELTENPSAWITDDETQWFPIEDYDEISYENEVEGSSFFFSYILLTSPCNNLEENGCWDGSS
jgi:hypothetical protein